MPMASNAGLPAAPRPATRLRWLVALGLLVVSLGCRGPATPADPTPREQLDQLPLVARSTDDAGYRRAAFGRSWADLDGDGCNTRDEVLLATVDTSRPFRTQRQGRCGADMVAGTWTDLYTGAVMAWTNLKDPRQAQRIPIDHIVSLAEAWRYGASEWNDAQRLRFANDPLELTPTTVAVNEQKSDQDPAGWAPPPVGRCPYVTRYIAVKARYGLAVDRAEKAGLLSLLDSCPA